MPSHKKESNKSTEDDTEDYDEDYRKKRDRNNQAVKRSRVKSKMKTEETVGRVSELRVKNEVLEEKIDNLTKELKFLKELFLAQAQAKSDKLTNVDLKTLLADMDSDEDEEDEEKPGTSKSKS